MKIKGFRFVDENGFHDLHETRTLIDKEILALSGLGPGVVVIESVRSLATFVRFLALIELKHPVFMLPTEEFSSREYMDFLYDTLGPLQLWPIGVKLPLLSGKGSVHPALENAQGCFIVKTSGTSGKKNKFVLHSVDKFFAKFKKRGSFYKKTLNFFPPDSIAGVETILEACVNGGVIVNPGKNLVPEIVIKKISDEKIDYLHLTPTFLNMLLLSGKFTSASLDSVEVMAFGSEPSQKSILEKVRESVPEARLSQVYGMSEIGLLKTITREDDPTWMRPDPMFNPYEVRNGRLYVKSESNTLGYLNAASAQEGEWFSTGDTVIEDHEWLKVVGRFDDVINVAGKKFHPIELEEILMEMEGVVDVTVVSEPNELIGNSVTAKFIISSDTDSFRKDLKNYLEAHVLHWMRPQRIEVETKANLSTRLKKRRK